MIFLSGDRKQALYIPHHGSRITKGPILVGITKEATVVLPKRITKNQTVVIEAPPGTGFSALGEIAKLDDPTDLIMPEIAEKLLPFILPRKLRVAVVGDLAEDFHTYSGRWGRRYALRWLWWEIAQLCIRRFGPTVIVMGISAWFRQKLGL
jgi:hypothetical protein